jgi:hypothetical protein
VNFRLHWPVLTWRKASWPAKTYHAKRGAFTYTVNHDGTSWTLRVWENGKIIPSPVSYGKSAADLQEVADAHAAQNSGDDDST